MKSWPTKKLVSFEEVLFAFDKEHNQQNGSNSWARNALVEANKKFSGKWRKIKLKRKQILQIVLPHHLGEEGEIELVPKTGLNVKATINKLKSIPSYKIKNPKCWEKIEYLETKPFSPIFLSTLAIDWDDYKNITMPGAGNFFHLDGLHRLISWGLEGRFNSRRYLFSNKIIAYIAGL